MGGLLRCIGVGVTRGEENVVDVFDELFRRQEGHVNVKLGEEKMARAYDGGGLLIRVQDLDIIDAGKRHTWW